MPRWQPQLWYRLNFKVLLIELGDVASLRLLRLNGRSRLSISSRYPDDDTSPSRCEPHSAASPTRRSGNGPGAGGSCETSRRQLLLRKVRCRQPEKILFSPQLPILLAEAVELLALLCGQQAAIGRKVFSPVNPGLPHPAGQAAGRKIQAGGHFVARKVFPQAELHGFCLLLSGEMPPVLDGRLVHGGQFDGFWATLVRLSLKPGEAQAGYWLHKQEPHDASVSRTVP
jgi:hypothetical protein